MPLGVEVLLGVHHLALEGEAGSHQGDHGGPWDQGALLEGSQAYRPEASVLVRDIQERVLAMVDHVVGHVVVNPLVCLLVDHLGCSVWSLVSLAYRFLSASGLASTSSCCSDCSVVFPHLELYLHYRWHVRLHSPSSAGPRHLRRHQPRGHRQICPRNPTHAQISADLLSSDVLQTYHRLEWMSGWGCVQRLAIAADGSCLSGPRAGPCCLLGSLMSCASVDPPWPEDLASRPLRHQEHQAYLADHAVQSAAGLRLVGGQGGRRG